MSRVRPTVPVPVPVPARPRARLVRLFAVVTAAAVVAVATVTGTIAGPRASGLAQDPIPTRIVSLVPAVTEMLFACGAGPAVVGVSSYDRYPAQAMDRPKVGALVDPDVEAIFRLKPDLVVVYATQSDLIAQLTRAGIPLFRYQHAGLSDITETIRRLGRRIDHVPETVRLAMSIEKELDAVRASVAGTPRPRTLLLFGREPGSLRGLYASGGVGFLHDLLVVAGGDDVFADVKQQSLQISTETVLARAPEVILEVHPSDGWTPDRIERETAIWSALPSVPAVRHHRVRILADDLLSIPGPRVAIAARMLAEALHAPGSGF
ncbi:MAG: helical backbone metal receptor [Vicinamibacterales bacterium]